MKRVVELLRLIKSCESIEGRKKLQKVVHILQCNGNDFGFRYSFYHHGPFSADLKNEIDFLVSSDFVCEVEKAKGDYTQYVYSLNSSCLTVMKPMGLEIEPSWSDFAKKLSKRPAKILESISTILYLFDLDLSESEVRDEFKRLKPHLIDKLESSLAEAQTLREPVSNTSG